MSVTLDCMSALFLRWGKKMKLRWDRGNSNQFSSSDHRNNILRRIQITSHTISSACNFLALRSKYFLWLIVLKHPERIRIALWRDTKFRTHTKQQIKLQFRIFRDWAVSGSSHNVTWKQNATMETFGVRCGLRILDGARTCSQTVASGWSDGRWSGWGFLVTTGPSSVYVSGSRATVTNPLPFLQISTMPQSNTEMQKFHHYVIL